MIVKKTLFILSVSVGLILNLTSCKPKENDDLKPSGAYENGVFIVNEGSFGNSNGSISFLNRNNHGIENAVFSNVNGRPLGDVVQSMGINNGFGYVVVNNSNKIEVVNADNFQSVATINGFMMPRYFIALNNSKGYVSEWVNFSGSGNIKVIDLTTNTIVKTIAVGEQPEKMLISGSKLYVCNSGDSTVMVINTSNDVTEDTIMTGHGPNSLLQDMNDDTWVLCGGKKVYNSDWSWNLTESTEGTLVKMTSSGSILASIPFDSKTESPSKLIANTLKDKLFYTYSGKVYDFDINSSALNSSALINRSFYGLGLDPSTNYILGGVAKDYIQTDYFYRYDQSGTLIDSFNVGIAANGFAFNQ